MNSIILDMNYKNTPLDSALSTNQIHAGYQFIYIQKGSVSINICGISMRATAPAVIMLNAFEEHALCDSSSDYTRYYFTINERDIDRITVDQSSVELLKFRPTNFRHVVDVSENAREFDWIFTSIYDEWISKSPYYECKISNDISNLIIMLHRIIYRDQPVLKAPQYLIDIQKYIEEEYATIKSIADISDKYFVNKFYLSRTFKHVTGYSPKEYLTLTRLNAAKYALLTTDLTVNEICYGVGFSDINNFIKLFKVKYATSPLKFRKANS